MEEVHLNGPGIFYNFDLTTFAPKIMQDIRDTQLPNGLAPNIDPEYVVFTSGFRDSPEWGSTAVILLFMYYEQYGTGSQDPNAMSVFADLVDSTNKKAVLDNLVKDIENHVYKLTTGNVGNWYLFQVLAQSDLNDIMYKMHNHKEVPGYGFQIQFGATTLTEQWDPRKGNSWNHFMMGQIEEWFFKSLAGINVDRDHNSGFQNIVIAPKLVDDLKFVESSYTTLYGDVRSEWKVENNLFKINISIPTNCQAKVYLPDEESYIKIGSGNYTFTKDLQ